MYPKNAASPEPIAIGPVIQISDGAVQTSGCTVRIKPIGVAEADGGGTTAYSTDGVVLYTPTQAETNYTSFILIAKKTGCIPASVTIITTSSATPGTVLLAPVTHTSATIPTVTTTTTATNVTTVNGLAADVITATAIAADAITDAKVASDVTIASVTGAVGSVTGNVGGNVVGSVGSVTGLTASNLDATISSRASAADLATVAGYLDTEIAAILADTNELQTDWANGGRLDVILDARSSQSSVDAIDTLADSILVQATIAAQKPEII